MFGRLIILFLFQSTAALFRLNPIPLYGVRGRTLTITCSNSESVSAAQFILRVQGRDVREIGSKFLGATLRGESAVEYTYGPLEASDKGAVFECNDTAGNSEATDLILLNPPSAPQKLRLSNISPFSVQLTWNPPMDANSYPDPTTYTVTLTNITDGTVLQYTLPSTQITLSNLLPGVQYNVSVYAKNTVGSGPPVTGVFRTNNSVPVVKEVSLYARRLRVLVDITLASSGGVPITRYHVMLKGRTMTYPNTDASNQTGISLELNRLTVKKGESIRLAVRVENELGNSTEVEASFFALRNPTEETAVDSAVIIHALSAVVALLGTLILTVIVTAVIIGLWVIKGRSEGSTNDKVYPPYEIPVVKNAEGQQITSELDNCLKSSPSYETLKVYRSQVEAEDAHTKHTVEHKINEDPPLQSNPSYEPL